MFRRYLAVTKGTPHDLVLPSFLYDLVAEECGYDPNGVTYSTVVATIDTMIRWYNESANIGAGELLLFSSLPHKEE